MTSWIDQIKNLKIVVLGDLMLDRYITGSVERVSPEAPVPILAYEGTEYRLGGAANVALNLKHLGAQVFLLGVIGTDAEGSIFKERCESLGISGSYLLSTPGRATTQKTRYMADDQHLLRVDKETTDLITADQMDRLFVNLEQIIGNERIDLLIFQDYDKGVLNEQLIARVTALCRSTNIQILVDPKFNNFWAYREVDLFKPNLNECAQALNTTKKYVLTHRSDVVTQIRKKLDNRITLLTLGADGIYIADRETEHLIAGIDVEVSDVCGAGDTVISVAACALGCNLPPAQIAFWSNQAAAWACTQPGVVPVDHQRLKSLVNEM